MLKSMSYLFERYLNWNDDSLRENQEIISCYSATMLLKLETAELIYPVAEGDPSTNCYVRKEDIFGVVHDAHLAIDHGGQNRMIKEA